MISISLSVECTDGRSRPARTSSDLSDRRAALSGPLQVRRSGQRLNLAARHGKERSRRGGKCCMMILWMLGDASYDVSHMVIGYGS
jgi:hypothetical protein